ncbi:uncharacterized protein E0L32_006869 [Thyridium curvatum]|uniref:Kelch repeat-containing protein n=1 Tax=Thyridium curvatum TaxID=1093900 RepID=A0A507AY62_9PEZI|nr:uncharacterized protein E0L32_006869 [Thyridium curvatum]TPX12457.1 hypothetical protein E0L32_006869 [Thyridium curvatum]
MSSKIPHCSSDTALVGTFIPPTRPQFNSHNTSDRLRVGSGTLPSFSMVKKDRKSMFREVGLEDHDSSVTAHHNGRGPSERDLFGEPAALASQGSYRKRSDTTGHGAENNMSPHEDAQDGGANSPRSRSGKQSWYSRLAAAKRPRIKSVSSAPPPTVASLSRFTMIALFIAVILPAFSYHSGGGGEKVSMSGADAGVIRDPRLRRGPVLDTRANSPTDVCTRWSHQVQSATAAQLNGTLYIYGGQAKTSGDQEQNTWKATDNNFVTLDLTKSWDISSPALKGLPQPSGPPAVANGYLWNDYENLFLYGGEFADNPFVEPEPMSTWKYSIKDRSWKQFEKPQTSAGNFSDPGGVPVQRSAEGAGVSVPELGLSWYFGGHLDLSTTQGWSNQIKRVYLKSLLEFTHPGYANNGVQSIAAKAAGEGGVYRNITQGGLQENDAAFFERADGVLVFVPGWGTSGVLVGLGGGTDTQFADDFSRLDVYDIANSTWYHQETRGEAPSVRVNPCAVVASAPDASSFQIYLFGGQNLQPYKDQIQYNDMYILSIPSFTWVRVDQGGSNKPSPRAGHTCNLRDGQMVVVGGYVGKDIPCDRPGIYVFNTSSLEWQGRFTALAHEPGLNAENTVLAASYGYKVPDRVAAVIGGSTDGGATATTPAAGPARDGPFATGHPPVYTVTQAGATATVTQVGPSGVVGGGGSNGNGNGSPSSAPPAAGDDGGSNKHAVSPGLVAAAAVAGLAGLLAGYLGFCAWLYRRQVRAYKTHLAVANRYSGAVRAGSSRSAFGGIAALFGRKGSKESRGGTRKKAAGAHKRTTLTDDPASYAEKPALLGSAGAAAGFYGAGAGHGHGRDDSTSTADSFGWVVAPDGGQQQQPKAAWMSDEPSPMSGTTVGAATASSASGGGGGGGLRRGDSGSPFFDEAAGPPVRRPPPSGMYGGGTGHDDGYGGGGRRGSDSGGSTTSSTEGLLEGREPSFFSVVLGPRRALRVVNGLEE